METGAEFLVSSSTGQLPWQLHHGGVTDPSGVARGKDEGINPELLHGSHSGSIRQISIISLPQPHSHCAVGAHFSSPLCHHLVDSQIGPQLPCEIRICIFVLPHESIQLLNIFQGFHDELCICLCSHRERKIRERRKENGVS